MSNLTEKFKLNGLALGVCPRGRSPFEREEQRDAFDILVAQESSPRPDS